MSNKNEHLIFKIKGSRIVFIKMVPRYNTLPYCIINMCQHNNCHSTMNIEFDFLNNCGF